MLCPAGARLRDGDVVTIDVVARRLNVAADLATRTPARIAPRVRHGVLAKYARDVRSASRGAVTSPGLLDAAAADAKRIDAALVASEPA